MAGNSDFQDSENLSREAEALLAEYFRIRREYNALDKTNPAHAGQRATLKERYHELDRKYSAIVQEQDRVVEDRQGAPPKASRADLLWNAAVAQGDDAPVAFEDPPGGTDESWVEMTTPPEGAATDAVFEEALKQVAAEDHFLDEEEQPDEPELELELTEPDPEPEEPRHDTFQTIAEDVKTETLADEHDEFVWPPTKEARPEKRESAISEIYTPRKKPTPPRPKPAPVAEPAAPPLACPSCGELLGAGTEVCTSCGARLISAENSDGIQDTVAPHLQMTTTPAKEPTNLGAKLVITLGWLVVLAAATWLIVRNANLWQEQIDTWLDGNNLAIVKDNVGGGILGISLALLGGTIVGLGILAGRFIRVVVSMHELARNGRVETIEKLIARGNELDERDARGCTPLHFAVVANQREVVAVLVGNGADINAHNDRGDTPLHIATGNRDHALVQYLISKGADTDATNDGGSSLMHVAALVGDVGLLKLFREKGLPVDGRTKVGFTPLHFAAQGGHDDAIEFLLQNGADPNAASDNGTTPIFPAARNGHVDAVRLLVDGGADYNTRRAHDFESPLGIARVHKRRDVYDYLESLGAED